MNRKKKLTTGLIFSIAIIINVLVITSIYPDFLLFQGEWLVAVDDTYQFEIESWEVDFLYSNLGESWVNQLLSLNGTVINATITSLPTLDFPIIKTSFIDNIVIIPKVSCTFSNGSQIPDSWLDRISQSISGCIIPVGSWQTLDAYYPTYKQIVDAPFSSEEPYFSELFGESFQFGKFRWGVDDTERWNGTISLDNGFPSQISWRYFPIAFELKLIS